MPAPSTYAAWPFRPFAARTPDEAVRWWQECYLPSEASRILQGWPHWRVIAGGPGSGKSVMLAEVERLEAERSFVVRYPPERWPGTKQAFVKDGNHLAQIMANAALVVPAYLSEHLDQIATLTLGQSKFIRWLLDTSMGSRAFGRWVDSLPADLTESLQSIGFEDFYQTTTESRDVHGQIDELVSLVRRLGFQRVLVSSDLNMRDAHTHLGSLGQLFEWLELMHHAGLSLIMAVPAEAVKEADLIDHARGRVNVATINWSVEQVREIAARHMCAATSLTNIRLEDYAQSALLAELESVIQAEYGGIAPQGWVILAETLLHMAGTVDAPRPFGLDLKPDIVRMCFLRHMPIELVPGQGLWRGPKLIPLDQQPLGFVDILWARQGDPVDAEDHDLKRLARTKGNVHTLARRVRKAIEPDPARPIYLRNDRGQGGYWLENVTRPVRKSPM